MPWTELQRRSAEETDSCWGQGPLARGPQLRADEESQNERPSAQCPQPAEVTGLRGTTELQRALCDKQSDDSGCNAWSVLWWSP